MRKNMVLLAGMAIVASACGQGRDNFMQQQAFAEMQRVAGQVDVLQNNLSDLQHRVGALEGGGDTRGIRQELEALKASVAELRRMMQSQRGEIVKDLSGRLSKMQQQMTPPPPPKPVEKRVVIAAHKEYTVQPGDNLSMIAEAFGTTVGKIKEMNGLKGNNLRVGQKLNVPK